MSHRRSRGEGSIYRRRTDGLWVGQIVGPDGKKKVKYSTQQKPVREWLQTQRNRLREGMWAKDENLSVSGFFDRFLEDVLKYKVRANTFESYSDIVRLHVKPSLGAIRLADLRPYHLQQLYKSKLESGLSGRSVQYIHAILHRGLAQAYKWGIVSRNIADLVVAPRPQKKEVRVFTPEECRLFLHAVKNDRLYCLYAIAIGCGLRLGELLALHWEHVDFENSTISIRRAMQKVHNKNIIGEPKKEGTSPGGRAVLRSAGPEGKGSDRNDVCDAERDALLPSKYPPSLQGDFGTIGAAGCPLPRFEAHVCLDHVLFERSS